MRMDAGYGGAAALPQPPTAAAKIAPYSQQLGDFFTRILSALVKHPAHIYSARLGMAGFAG
jgi:hypothetical protein